MICLKNIIYVLYTTRYSRFAHNQGRKRHQDAVTILSRQYIVPFLFQRNVMGSILAGVSRIDLLGGREREILLSRKNFFRHKRRMTKIENESRKSRHWEKLYLCSLWDSPHETTIAVKTDPCLSSFTSENCIMCVKLIQKDRRHHIVMSFYHSSLFA